MNKKFVFLFAFFFGFITTFLVTVANAEDSTTVPTSTIGSIDGPADVGTPTTTPTDDQCMPNGQTEYGLLPCEFGVTTTVLVEVGEPPVSTLPSTGLTAAIGIWVGLAFITCGTVLSIYGRHRVD